MPHDLPIDPHPADDPMLDGAIARAMVLLGSLAAASGTYEGRRRQLGNGLAAILDADVWIWARSRHPSGAPGVIFDTVDGGFTDEAERARFFAAVYLPAVSDAFNRAMHGPLSEGATVPGAVAVRTRDIEEAMPEGTPVRTLWRDASGMDAALMCTVPLDGPSWSGLGFHRRVGRPAFGAGDRRVAHLVVAALDGLHRDGSDIALNSDRLFAFRPRERQVLLYLLAGDATKQIAAKLGISHHTAADYVKVIYRRLGVRTRSELMRLFLPGSPPPGDE